MLLTSTILTLLLFLFTHIYSIRIGSISNAIYLSSNDLNQVHSNLTCIQCSCLALRLNAVGWNCNYQCQVIMNYSQNDMGLMQSENTTYFFLIMPPERSKTTTCMFRLKLITHDFVFFFSNIIKKFNINNNSYKYVKISCFVYNQCLFFYLEFYSTEYFSSESLEFELLFLSSSDFNNCNY